jgi:sulfoxide reductase catalytic subunit YedY
MMIKIHSSEITPEQTYLNRRAFLRAAGAVAGAGVLAACGTEPAAESTPTEESATPFAAAQTDELGDPLSPHEAVTGYNNYYEFTTDKGSVAKLARDFRTSPWTVEVGGLVESPRTFGIEDLLGAFDQEERIYRLRCVEGWSMVIPWLGFPLAALLEQAGPTGDARYVRFEALLDPEQMPGQQGRWFDWPYVEGLRLDEAMNDLTLMATGVYGKSLPNQNGAPLRLVVPWKYGFKSIKGIVRIDLVAERPTSLWMDAAPNEYGFYANVNPSVDHPRWSQASERRIGEAERRATMMFNGYEQEVGALYAGMDLRANF